MQVPFLDLQGEYQLLGDDIRTAVLEVLASGSYILGPKGRQLEQDLAAYVGTKHALGVANGTDALLLTLEALGIGLGDEVITTPFTFFATAEVIASTGATPVFVDIDPATYNLDPNLLEAAITARTKAVLLVHLFGQVADMEKIQSIAAACNVPVIEDACQAMGASYQGKKAGSFGIAGCFSFFPTKNLGGFGDGGLITTDDDDLAHKIIGLRNHGSYEKYVHVQLGLNSRLDELQAAVLSVKFKVLDAWNEKRRALAQRYTRHLQGIVQTPAVAPDREHIYHQYSIESPQRDTLAAHLQAKGIATGIYYPIPLHLQQVFSPLGHCAGDFPVSEAAARRILALPIHPLLTEVQQDYVIEAIRESAGDRS
ncbi:DegT/DnrJ/EryC1/StrS family aminotransferase [Tumebacillus sp. ITR2]|uniref:DegT/DnrJ/EryC1/StrS family aminotransferase n=1 Tax=Tumebacillus amylolyticus TaxID=2801339 RepID=A0ABS1JCL5_9BACL|nr:DegT/DnrJ/EryC1/StrS family aminotransferase [Tumebacillus amylolyticus]MBL0388012.1 DegT/DnrJ/EryC1/StrS family aminotransferase [Tumebacillus amylolyticus]